MPVSRLVRYPNLLKNKHFILGGTTMDLENFIALVMAFIVALYFIGATTSILVSEYLAAV